MTKEDYMRLPKERLAELLAKKDWLEEHRFAPYTVPYVQCYDKNGTCANPFRDCINCPRQFGSEGNFTTTNISIEEPL